MTPKELEQICEEMVDDLDSLKIISGGQTGADQGGLFAAYAVGVPTGGWAPKQFWTESGPAYFLRSLGLKECKESVYIARTRRNVQEADVTVLFGNMESIGSKATLNLCQKLSKSTIINPTSDQLVGFIRANKASIINIAGNRETVSPGICEEVFKTVKAALNELGYSREGTNDNSDRYAG